MAIVWWCHVKSLISWHFLLMRCHVWSPNQTVFRLFGSQTLFLSLSIPSPDQLSALPTLCFFISPLWRCNTKVRWQALPFSKTEPAERPLRAEQPGLCCWLCYKTQRGALAGSASCKRQRLFSEKANGSLSVGLKEEAKKPLFFQSSCDYQLKLMNKESKSWS